MKTKISSVSKFTSIWTFIISFVSQLQNTDQNSSQILEQVFEKILILLLYHGWKKNVQKSQIVYISMADAVLLCKLFICKLMNLKWFWNSNSIENYRVCSVAQFSFHTFLQTSWTLTVVIVLLQLGRWTMCDFFKINIFLWWQTLFIVIKNKITDKRVNFFLRLKVWSFFFVQKQDPKLIHFCSCLILSLFQILFLYILLIMFSKD